MSSSERTLLSLILATLFLAGCGGNAPPNPTDAQHTYGASVDPADALPGTAVFAERDRYAGRRVTVEGRIAGVEQGGCAIRLATDNGSSLRFEATREEDGSCAWSVPTDLKGFAVARGTLRADSALHLPVDGVQVTPFRANR